MEIGNLIFWGNMGKYAICVIGLWGWTPGTEFLCVLHQCANDYALRTLPPSLPSSSSSFFSFHLLLFGVYLIKQAITPSPLLGLRCHGNGVRYLPMRYEHLISCQKSSREPVIYLHGSRTALIEFLRLPSPWQPS